MDEPLYRYCRLKHFEGMLNENELTLISPRKWEDKYESYLFQALKTDEGKKRILEYIRGLPDYREGIEVKIEELINITYNSTYCLCFSKNNDNELLWSARSTVEDGIMFATTTSTLQNVAKELIIESVEYDLLNKSKLNDELNRLTLFDNTPGLWGTNDLVLHKRADFKYESEVRAIYFDYDHPGKDYIKLPVQSASLLINGVMLHPKANTDIEKRVAALCESYSIPFFGKSKIYDITEIR